MIYILQQDNLFGHTMSQDWLVRAAWEDVFGDGGKVDVAQRAARCFGHANAVDTTRDRSCRLSVGAKSEPRLLCRTRAGLTDCAFDSTLTRVLN